MSFALERWSEAMGWRSQVASALLVAGDCAEGAVWSWLGHRCGIPPLAQKQGRAKDGAPTYVLVRELLPVDRNLDHPRAC